MALAGFLVEVVFGALGLVPHSRQAIIAEPSITLNYTTVLNLVLLALGAVLVWRGGRTGGVFLGGEKGLIAHTGQAPIRRRRPPRSRPRTGENRGPPRRRGWSVA